jgi:hypothetical protein
VTAAAISCGKRLSFLAEKRSAKTSDEVASLNMSAVTPDGMLASSNPQC